MANIRPLNAALAKVAAEDLGEVPSRLSEDIARFREWINAQPHLRARTDDQFLVAFLRGCKFSLEKAKQKIDFFYAVRASVPEIFRNRFVNEKTLDLLRAGIFLRLANPIAENGPRIQVMRLGKFDPNKFTMADMMTVNYMISEIQLHEDDQQTVAGFVYLIDLGNIAANAIFQFDAMLTKKVTVIGEKAWPNRVKGFHFINTPKSAETLLSFAKNLMSDKFKKRFFIHTSLESLHKHIPKECLPSEYGGSDTSTQHVIDTWEKKFLSYKQYFEEDVKYGTDEHLRKNSPKLDAESLFGIEGSFRKLDFD